MLILTIRTDRPEAEIGLFQDQRKLSYETWHAHRELSLTLHQKVLDVLKSRGKLLDDLEAVVAFKGPGSFTGLRIGLSVANALAYGKQLPAVSTSGEQWIEAGITRLLKHETETVLLPEYGAPAHTTQQKK